MLLPNGLTTRAVVGTFPASDGTALPCEVTFTPSCDLTDATGKVIIPAQPVVASAPYGVFSITLVTTDNADIQPQGWSYVVTVKVGNNVRAPYNILVPAGASPLPLSSAAPVSANTPVSQLYGVLAAGNTNAWQSSQTFAGPVQVNDGLSIAGTAIANPPGGTTSFLRADGSWASAGGTTGALLIANNLSDVADFVAARSHLGLGTSATKDVGTITGTVAAGVDARIIGAAQSASLGTAATKNVGTTAGTVAAGDDSRIVGAAQASSLGNAAGKNVGTIAGTVAAGDDSRIVGAAQASSLGSAATKNVGTTAGTVAAGDDSRIVGAAQSASLGTAATKNVGTAAGTVAAGDDSRITGALQQSSNLSDVPSKPSARSNLGLGNVATTNVGFRTGVLAEVLPVGLCAASGGSTLTASVLILNLVRPGPIVATNLGVWITAAGVTANGSNVLALFDEAGNLIDQTADLSTQFAAAGFVEAPLGNTHQLVADTNYYLGVLTHFTTAPKAGASLAGAAVPAIKGHYISLTKSSTVTLPASFTPSALTISTAQYYLTIS